MTIYHLSRSQLGEIRDALRLVNHPTHRDIAVQEIERVLRAVEAGPARGPSATRLRVFISGPYSSDPEGNTRRAMDAAHALLDAGHAPFCPHLSHFLDRHRTRPYEEWMALDFEFLRVCQAVLRLPGESPGADRECALAIELGIPVVESVEELDRLSPASVGRRRADGPAAQARGLEGRR